MPDQQEARASTEKIPIFAGEFPTIDGKIYYEIIEPVSSNEDTNNRVYPTITLLHNFMSTGRSAWGPLLDKLASNYRLVVPDLPGHGRSLGYPARFHYGRMAEQLADLMESVGITTGHLVGCSAGGMIAQLLVHHEWIQPQSLTLVSTTYSINEKVIDQKQALSPENFRAGRRWMEATSTLHDRHRYAGYYEQELLPAFRNLNPESAIDLPLEALQQWSMPVCLIHGTNDEFFPVPIVQQMAAVIPNVLGAVGFRAATRFALSSTLACFGLAGRVS